MNAAAGQALKFIAKAGAPLVNSIAGKTRKLKSKNAKAIDEAYEEEHHYATNKSPDTWSPKMQAIIDRYGLKLDGKWNKDPLKGHKGRHPNKYHEWIQAEMEQAAKEAGDDVNEFLRLFNERVVNTVQSNPEMVHKAWWDDL
jgi:hypothetical protein